MKHLNEAEFVALLEGQISETRARHADGCAECRKKADDLRLVLRDVLSDRQPPEPSPLFWDHFAVRVADAVREDPSPSLLDWLRRPAATWMVTASAALLVVVLFAWRTTHAPAPVRTPPVLTGTPADAGTSAAANAATATGAGTAANAGLPAGAADDINVELDEAWAVVRAAVDGLEWEDAYQAGISARPGSAERVALELSGEERVELARLIEGALKRSGA